MKGKPRGRPWKKGQSGNPGGRPKDVHGIAALARTFSAEAIEKLVELMRDKTMPPRAVIAAIEDGGNCWPHSAAQRPHGPSRRARSRRCPT